MNKENKQKSLNEELIEQKKFLDEVQLERNPVNTKQITTVFMSDYERYIKWGICKYPREDVE